MIINIKLDSHVKVITNSSSSIYVKATSSTIDNFKSLINSLLVIAGSNETADDLFFFRLIDDFGDDEDSESIADTIESGRYEVYVEVVPKVDLTKLDPVTQKAYNSVISILGCVTGTYDIQEYY